MTSKPPSPITVAANHAAAISFDDLGDFVFASEQAPESVHPGLWRQARLNVKHGLFEVADGVWQVRGYDLANITFMAGTDGGWLVIDPLTNAPSAAAARAAYQFGPLLPPGPLGQVDCGLGSAMSLARSDLLAPAEMNFHFPDRRLFCMAENCTHTMHQLYPLRGAQVRNALAWSKYIQEAMELWSDSTDTMFASHHWPRFGQDDVRGYYGTVSHNCKSVYNRYLGWYDGNPANLDPLPRSNLANGMSSSWVAPTPCSQRRRGTSTAATIAGSLR